MARGLNRVFLIGRLGRDPELRSTPTGQQVANFTLATDEVWLDKNNQWQQRTEWHRIVAWGRLAEFSHQYLAKGKLVFVEGRLQSRSWEDREGNKRTTTEIRANRIIILEKKGETVPEEEVIPDEVPPDDDIPF
ncbi:MAG: single-stranded DNA-binding protein [Acidobacteria bacterium]|nr:single-stranded DNA-binding protein [Acidobacteriota bacterium]